MAAMPVPVPVTGPAAPDTYCEYELAGATRLDQAAYCDDPAEVEVDGTPICAHHAPGYTAFLTWALAHQDEL